MIIDPMQGREMQSSQSEGYCLKIILAALCSNILLSIIQPLMKIYDWIKRYRSKTKVFSLNAETMDNSRANNQKKIFIEEKINKEYGLEFEHK
jgi:hypothetical protein